MVKSITLETIDKRFTKLESIIERGFGSVASDISDLRGDVTNIKTDVAGIKRDMATKDQLVVLHTQINSIEHELRDIKRSLTKVVFQEDLDEALRRIAAIEKRLGIKA